MSEDISNAGKGRLRLFLSGTVIGIAVTLFFMLIFAAVIYFLNLDREYSVPLSTLSLALGSFAAAYFVSRKIGNRGYLFGTLVGLVAFAAVTIISLILTKNGLTLNTLFHFIIIVLASAIGGILGVNKGKDKKYI